MIMLYCYILLCSLDEMYIMLQYSDHTWVHWVFPSSEIVTAYLLDTFHIIGDFQGYILLNTYHIRRGLYHPTYCMCGARL